MKQKIFDISSADQEIYGKDGEGNLIKITEAGGLNVGDGSLGGFQELVIDDTPSGNQDNTNTSFAAISGISQQTFTTPVYGPHLFQFTPMAFAPGTGDTIVRYQLVIDKGTANEQILPSSGQWRQFYDTGSDHEGVTFNGILDLTAGEHTVDAELLVSANTIRRNTTCTTQLIVSAMGSGINGLETQEDTIPSDIEFLSTAGSPADTGLEISFNSLENEYIKLDFIGTAQWTQGASLLVNVFTYTQLDGGSNELLTSCNIGDPASAAFTSLANISGSKLIGPLSAGPHTIKIRAEATGSGTRAWKLLSSNASLQITRFKVLNTSAAENYVDRGDPSAVDFSIGDFTKDGVYHDLDLSSIVPAEAAGKRVHVTVALRKSVDGGSSFALRENGNSNSINFAGADCNDANKTTYHDLWVICDSNRIIEYVATNIATWTTMNLTVRGWMVPGGGIEIPIQEEGSNILTAPSAINFVGPGTTVTDVGGVATVTDNNDPQDTADLVTLSGVSENSTDLGTFTGSTISDNQTIKAALQEIETALEEIDVNVNDLITLSGVAENSTNLGTFTGGTIADSETIKGALQDLEDGHETHDHSNSTNQTRLAAKDRIRFSSSEKHDADSAAADTLSEHMVMQAQDAVTVTKIFFLPDAALTANDTDYAVLTVYRRDADGTNQVSVATVNTQTGGSGNWTAFDGIDLGTISNSSISTGQVLTFEITKQGSGVVVPAGTLQIETTVD